MVLSPALQLPSSELSTAMNAVCDQSYSSANAGGSCLTNIAPVTTKEGVTKFGGRQTINGKSCGGNPSIPIITSFAMKEEGASPCVPGDNGTFHQVVSPRNVNELFSFLKGDEFSTIRYSAYRTASKLDALRNGLCLDVVRLSTVIGVFHQHGHGQPLLTPSSNGATPSLSNVNMKHTSTYHGDVIIERQKALDIVSGIFFAAGKVRF